MTFEIGVSNPKRPFFLSYDRAIVRTRMVPVTDNLNGFKVAKRMFGPYTTDFSVRDNIMDATRHPVKFEDFLKYGKK